MNPENLGNQFKEHVQAIEKMQRIDARFGENYGFLHGEHHDPANGTYHTVMYAKPTRQWAGEIQHYDDGHVGHLYVEKEHRAGLPSLLLRANETAARHGGELPMTGREMTPKAEKLFNNQLPQTRKATKVVVTKPINTYGDK